MKKCGLDRANDEIVWNFARENGFTIVSKDSDFHQRSFLYGYPPKVVWLRLPNCSTEKIEAVLKESSSILRRFSEDSEHAFLVIS